MRPIATRMLPAADTERGENSFIMGPQIIPEELNNILRFWTLLQHLLL